MKKQILSAAAAVAVTISYSAAANAADLVDPVGDPVPASIEDTSFYIAARLGAGFADDTDFDLNAAAAVPTGIINGYDDWGISGAAAFGFSYGNGFRAEIELGAAQYDVDSHTVTALAATLGGASAFGETTAVTGLINGYYDFDLGGFKPYVTAGIGYGHLDFDNHGIVVDAATAAASGLPVGNVTAMDDSGGGFAWQIGVGTSFEISEGLDLELGYRYSGIENVSLTAVDATSTDVDFRSHTIMTGIRVSF